MAEDETYRASTTAPVNIAVIKYWGKRDPKLNLPTNSSLSVTLSQADLRTHTTASCSSLFTDPDSLLINSEPQNLNTPRSLACIKSLRALRADLEAADRNLPKLSTYPLRLVSTNNFPTAAGLASSAAGFAALVRAIADLYKLPASPTALSQIARQGSGSACRSLFGGYVAWRMGSAADGTDSQAEQVAPASHWPDMRALILVASAARKTTPSTAGMQATVATSGLFATRASTIVPAQMTKMEKAIKARDFQTFGQVTMQESNSFHATCLDTSPPIFYLNDVSRAAIRVVEDINAAAGKIVAAYTFDAGPNAVVYFLEEDKERVAGVFKAVLAGVDGWGAGAKGIREKKLEKGDAAALETLSKGVSRVIYTGVGEGPISTEEHLSGFDGNPI
ncbi:MAG: hypothetical protein M4579_006978 [Chaenotheca gracillima]|nr:MAG: hypothetical protein M4579_006978 [Chaenotheca gracillima]